MLHLVVGAPGCRGPGRPAPTPTRPSRGSPGYRRPPPAVAVSSRCWPRDGSTGPRPRRDRAGDGDIRVLRLRSPLPGTPTRPPPGQAVSPARPRDGGGGSCVPAHPCAWRGGTLVSLSPVAASTGCGGGDNEGPCQWPGARPWGCPRGQAGLAPRSDGGPAPPWGPLAPVPKGPLCPPPPEAKAAAAHPNPEWFIGGNTEPSDGMGDWGAPGMGTAPGRPDTLGGAGMRGGGGEGGTDGGVGVIVGGGCGGAKRRGSGVRRGGPCVLAGASAHPERSWGTVTPAGAGTPLPTAPSPRRGGLSRGR